MIYINATADGEMTTLVKPLVVSNPYSYYDSTMKVFKGVETDSGTVNWVEPGTLNPPQQDLQLGSVLYHSKCATCHGRDVREPSTGPSLANLGLEKLEMIIVPGDCGGRALADSSSK